MPVLRCVRVWGGMGGEGRGTSGRVGGAARCGDGGGGWGEGGWVPSDVLSSVPWGGRMRRSGSVARRVLSAEFMHYGCLGGWG